ncbi:unnamed protein product [Rotaria socialis]|uniref:Endonuclease/exonuclease/phosphatase domain-containing protein n=1 Tax=Rotaria socialis TaxID=392032 RepID=A0A817TBX7_9BILA|nr:unnamed protein product [Rotaria socialis]CAF3297726.1 unnamed protein product [Rotaria socialis]CAF3317661.1 unnamed protein product [Rotaria socialis]CAF3319137.1 unnamed protein product [Rotaria socialis]CAF3633425.1 unnamed protein product [Rotaria socialis]
MKANQTCDLLLMSWNILAPCWVEKEWYPSVYDLAADHHTRIKVIASNISAWNCNVIMIQEAQENMIPLFQEKLGDRYISEFAPNNPSSTSLANGLLTLIHKDWRYAGEARIINGILDSKQGDAIQIIFIPSKNIHLVNLHLDYICPLPQAKMVKSKCNELLGTSSSMSIMAGDLNADKIVYDQFEWIEFKNVFNESNEDKIIPSYYTDRYDDESDISIDHIFYDPNQVALIEQGKAWNTQDRSLEDALRIFGSDHIYVWASFNFMQH